MMIEDLFFWPIYIALNGWWAFLLGAGIWYGGWHLVDWALGPLTPGDALTDGRAQIWFWPLNTRIPPWQRHKRPEVPHSVEPPDGARVLTCIIWVALLLLTVPFIIEHRY